MKIKKFDAKTEQEAIEKVKIELGMDALVLSIKTTKPKGVFAFLRSPLVEVTAAYDEKKIASRASPDAKPPSDKELEFATKPTETAAQQTPHQMWQAHLIPPPAQQAPEAFEKDLSKMSQVDKIVESIQVLQSLEGSINQGKQQAQQQAASKNKAEAMPTHGGILVDPDMFSGQDYEGSGEALGADPMRENNKDFVSLPPPPDAPSKGKKSKAIRSDEDEQKLRKQAEKIKSLEKKLHSTEDLLASTMQKLTVSKHTGFSTERKYDNNILQIFYNTLTSQGVDSAIAQDLLSDVIGYELLDVEVIVKVVYSKIVKMLGNARLIDVESAKIGSPVIITFIGPTGVGKTTTIAKLSSLFILGLGKNVGLITADTYRIAAVEQLRTYSEILGAPIKTAYNKKDVEDAVSQLTKDCDIIIIDTAGRSHKHKENVEELRQLLQATPESSKYLVLSTTTKSEDMLSIIELYSSLTDFSLIFTKLDETNCLGAILNTCYVSGKMVSYVTTGQNVPDDIEVMQPEKIAKALLGFGTI